MPITNFEQLKEGCPLAFAAIHAKYSKTIFWVGKRMIDDEFAIETLVQDTFLKLWMHRDRIETPDHIYYFLRFVMKRECITFYTRPRNDFYRKLRSLENYENYQDYMLGYDPLHDAENLKAQNRQQKYFERIQIILPLLSAESARLIALCLKYGFKYKLISKAMGTSTTQTYNIVKKTIADIKTIIDHGSTLESKKTPKAQMTVQEVMTPEQAEVLKLRCEEKHSFAEIATILNLSQKEVHAEFIAAYKLIPKQQPA